MNLHGTVSAEGPETLVSRSRIKTPGRPLFGFLVAALLLWPAPLWSETEATPAWIKIYVREPGVYAVTFSELLEASGDHGERISGPLRLTHRGQPVAAWRDSNTANDTVHGARLIFVVTQGHLLPRDRHGFPALAVLKLEFGGPGLPDLTLASGLDPERPLRRLLHLEEDRLRVALTQADLKSLEEEPSLWHWALLSHRASSFFEVDLGPLTDLATRPSRGVDVQVHLLGWSKPEVDAGTPHHRVEVFWNDRSIGSSSWNGRKVHSISLENLPSSLVSKDSNRLKLKIPRRLVDEDGTDFIDMAYLDRIQVSYERIAVPAESQLALRLPESTRATEAVSAGDSTDAIFPACIVSCEAPHRIAEVSAATAFQAGPQTFLEPIQIARASHPWRHTGEDLALTDYVMIVPPEFQVPAKSLATFHRANGLHPTVVNAHWVYDHFGDGTRHPKAIRDFLLNLHSEHGHLRYVLLVGDAEWRSPDELPMETTEPHRNLLPTWTYLSRFGPAASDHLFTVANANELAPRFALGRLPVGTTEDFRRVVDKILRYAGTPSSDVLSALLLASDDPPSHSGLRRLVRGWQENEAPRIHLRQMAHPENEPLDAVLRQHFLKQPDLVYFNGHGSRHLWRLGKSTDFRPSSFFDEDEALALPATSRPPVVLSISCATAPFDHPDTGTLAETMVLDFDGGAIAFFGASARLFTPPRFGKQLLESLSQGTTFGEALVQAKTIGRKSRLSHLYQLIGDPALSLNVGTTSAPVSGGGAEP